MTLPTSLPRTPRLYIHSPTVVFRASVFITDPVEYPLSFVAYDNVTIGDYTDIKPGMTITLGTTYGGDDLGRHRITSGSSAISLQLGYTSRGTRDGELLVIDNAYITVYDERRLWAKIPFIDSAGEVFKDRNIEVGTNNEEPPPVAVAGPGTAGTAVDGELIVMHTGQASFAVADGATITDFLWGIGDGTLVFGTLADDIITVSYPPGFRYISLTVTDSNGKTHTTEREVFVDDPDNRLTTTNFRIASTSLSDVGQVVTIELLEELSRSDYPDGALVMIWDKEPTAALERDHIFMRGWLDTERSSIGANETGFLKNDTLTIIDIGGRLSKLPGFAQVLYDEILRDIELEPDTTWQYMPSPTLDKFMVYLLFWHCTALEIADFYPSGTWGDYPFVELQASGSSLYAQVATLAEMLVPDHKFIVTTLGQMKVVPDQMLLDEADRTGAIIVTLQEHEWREVSWDYNRSPRIHALWGHATLSATEYEEVDDDLILTTVTSLAPGTIYGQGLSESTWREQLAKSQADLNSVTGHRYARLNSRFGPMTIQVPGPIVRDEFELELNGWIVLNISAEKASRRGLPSTTIRGILTSCSISRPAQATGQIFDTTLVIEVETFGEPALSWNPETGEAGEDDGDWTPPEAAPPPLPPTTPPSDGLIEGQQLVAAIDGRTGANPTLYRTTDFQTPSGSGGPTWTAHTLGISDDFLRSFVVDPFSPGYLTGIGAINAWAVGNEAIWRIEDMFGTPSATAIYTYSDSIDGTSRFVSRSIQASFGAFFEDLNDNPWLMVVSHYADASGHTGTWANYSLDAGVTWSGDKLISAHYDTDLSGSEPQVITSVYLSPKTPGLAYACAYLETSNPAVAGASVSTDWGETWTALSGLEDPDEPLPNFGSWPTDGSLDGWTLLGRGNSQTVSVYCESSGPITGDEEVLTVAPPIDTKRIKIRCDWSATNTRTGGLGSQGAGLSIPSVGGLGRTGSSNFTQPPTNSSTSGSFEMEWTTEGAGDFPGNRDAIEAAPPATQNGRIRFEPGVGTDASEGHTRTESATITLTVLEIELDDGTIYEPTELGTIQPEHRLGGYLHGPWLDNDDEGLWYYGHVTRGASIGYRLKKSSGGVVSDISPTDSGKLYGENRTTFGVRTHDSDPDKVLLGGVANDTSTSTADDVHAIFLSEDEGATFDLIYGPLVESDFGQTKGFGVAFSGDALDVIFAWGAKGGDPGTILYSDNNGVSFDDRSGNLSALAGGSGPDGFIGIAGGPT